MTTLRAHRRFLPSFDLMPSRITPSDMSVVGPMDPTNTIPTEQMVTPPALIDPMDPTNTIPTSQMITPVAPPSTLTLADSTSSSQFSHSS